MEMVYRWRHELMAGGLGAVASSAAMIHAGLPEGPSLLPLLAAMAIMTTSVGLAGGSWLGQPPW